MISYLELEKKIDASMRKSLAESGLFSTSKLAPMMGMTPEEDADEKLRSEREMQALADKLRREEEKRQAEDQKRAERLAKNLRGILGI